MFWRDLLTVLETEWRQAYQTKCPLFNIFSIDILITYKYVGFSAIHFKDYIIGLDNNQIDETMSIDQLIQEKNRHIRKLTFYTLKLEILKLTTSN